MKKKILIVIVGFYFIVSCSKSSSSTGDGTGGGATGGSGGGTTVNCTGVAATFAANVNPIIQTSCATDASCHGSGSVNGPGPLLTYSQISGASALIKTVIANGTMPKTGTFTTAQRNTIICWVNAGALNN